MSLVDILKKLQGDESSKDVTLKVQGDAREIRAHRLILSGASEYFSKLFTADFQEKDQQVITLQGLKFETLQLLISYLYTDKFEFPENCSLKDAILGADYLMIDCVIKPLNEYALANVNKKNMWDMIRIEDKLSKDVLEKAMELIGESFMATNFPPDLSSMKFNELLAIVKHFPYEMRSNSYGLSSVKSGATLMLTEIVSWVQVVPGRRPHLFTLLSAVKWTNIDVTFLMEELFPLCKSDPESLSLLVALLGRQSGYRGTVTKKYLGDNDRYYF